ncbi:sugar phosphate isomerase/epimerase family protein [candidate division KSB1 bacterium]
MFPLAVISDEIDQDLEHSLAVCRELGLDGIELRTAWGVNLVDMDKGSIERAAALIDRYKLPVVAIASPLFKVHRRSGEEGMVGDTFFASGAGPEEHLEMIPKLVDLCRTFRTGIVRCFSFWREPELTTEAVEEIAEYLAEALKRFRGSGVVLALENEQETNLGTAAHCRPVLEKLAGDGLKLVWDPGNALVAGENPFPEGYGLIKDHVAHVHLKDVIIGPGPSPAFVPIGDGHIDYRGQLQALADDGYEGYLSLETHYVPEGGDKEAGTRAALAGLRDVLRTDGLDG